MYQFVLFVRWLSDLKSFGKNDRGERIRTSDLLVPNQARYQATPRPEMSNGEVLSDRWKPRPGQTTSATLLPSTRELIYGRDGRI